MTSIADTRQELVHLVLPEHANILGTLFGGRMMYWIVSAATLATLRLARSSVVLGSMDHLDFLGPVRVGDLVILQSQVEYVGRASMEVGVEVETENPRTGERRRATSAHLGMVAVDETGCPKPVGTVIDPAGAAEEAAAVEAQHRKQERMKRIADRRTHAADVEADLDLRYAIEASRIVFPEDAAAGNMMFAGTLLLQLDEFASIVAVRYARGAVVTASLDALDFYAPIFVGNIVTHKAAINYVGRTSMEVGIRVMAEDPITTAIRHTCTAYLTAVHIGSDHLPAPVPPFAPETPGEHRRWQEAEARRALRERRGSL